MTHCESSPQVCFDAKQTWLRVAGQPPEPRASDPATSRSSAKRRKLCKEHALQPIVNAWRFKLVSRQPRPPLGLRPYYCSGILMQHIAAYRGSDLPWTTGLRHEGQRHASACARASRPQPGHRLSVPLVFNHDRLFSLQAAVQNRPANSAPARLWLARPCCRGLSVPLILSHGLPAAADPPAQPGRPTRTNPESRGTWSPSAYGRPARPPAGTGCDGRPADISGPSKG